MEREKLDDPSIVLFSGAKPLRPGEVELHFFTEKLFGKNLNDVKKDWHKVSGQLHEMIDNILPESPKGFSVDNITVSLGFSFEGRLVFIAEAGVEASISIEFKRVSDAQSNIR